MSRLSDYIELKNKIKTDGAINASIGIILTESTEPERKAIDDKLEALFKKLVPGSGHCKTFEGEMVRAMMRLMYRYYNDGDVFFRGYGKETCGSSATFLKTKTPISRRLRSILSEGQKNAPKKTPGSKHGERDNEYEDDDWYQNALYKAAEAIIEYVNSKNGDYTPNAESSR